MQTIDSLAGEDAGADAPWPTVAVCLIVRDSAATLERALISVWSWVDELIIVDTGSTDDTMAIAARYTDRLYTFAWCDSFAAARQYAYDQATADWIIHLDADDELRHPEEIKPSCAAAPDAVGGLAWRYVTERAPGGGAVAEIWRERCTRRGAYHWQGRVHEVLIADGPWLTVPDDAVWVDHHGYDHTEASTRRNVRLLALQLGEGEVPRRRTLWYLMRDYSVLQEWHEVIRYGTRYMFETANAAGAGEHPTHQHERYMAHLMHAHALRRMGDVAGSRDHDVAAVAIAPLIPHAYFGLAQSAHFLGRWRECIHWCDIARALPMPASSVIPGASLELQAGWMVLFAEALAQAGQLHRAAAVCAAAAELRPHDDGLAQLAAQIAAAIAARSADGAGAGAELTYADQVELDQEAEVP